MICEYCGKETDGTYGSGRFCSHLCQCRKNQRKCVEASIKSCKLKAQKRHEQIQNEEHICEKCGKHYLRKDGISKRFCSSKCAHSRNHSDETKQKVSKTLLKQRELGIYKTNFNIRYCKDCGKLLGIKNTSGYCHLCCPKHTNARPELREKHKQIQLQKVADGTHKGWTTRNIKSYAERFFETVLNNNKIKYNREKKVGKYFLDFVIGNIDLEIDGKQHKYKDRKESDTIRDEFLRKQGYFVYRIAWNEINTNEGKQMIKDKIELFLDFYDFITQ